MMYTLGSVPLVFKVIFKTIYIPNQDLVSIRWQNSIQNANDVS